MLAGLRGKAASELRIGLGRDMRLTAPELAARYRDGMVAEGAHVLDAGMVGTEMLYFLVGSRELDGGLMCTASHNPKAYTGAKLVREGALRCRATRGSATSASSCAAGCRAPDGAPGSVEDVDVAAAFRERALGVRRPVRDPAVKVVLDGGNGMAGPMVGPILERLGGLELVPTYWEPDGEFPDHEPNPLLPENRRFVIEKVRSEGADLGIAWDGDADRCFFIDGDGEFVDGDFLTRAARPLRARVAPGRRHPLRRARLPRGRRHGRAAGGTRTSTASGTRSSRRGCARRAARSAARSPATTTSPTSTTPTPGRSPRC